MTNADTLDTRLEELQYLAVLQRGLRTVLRAFWLGASGVLLGWSVNTLWGWLPGMWTWVMVGLIFGLTPVAAFLISLTSRSQWLWLVDRRLGLQEQFSTVWDVIQNGERGQVSEALIADVLAILPQVKQRMLKYGWFLERDLVAALIVLLLSILVLASGLIRPFPDFITSDPAAFIPPVEEFQPSGAEPDRQQPAQPEQQNEQPGDQGIAPLEGDQPGGEQPGSDSLLPEELDLDALADALSQMGADLSNQAATHELGQALQQLDLEGAAGALENLADQLDQLSPETREKTSEAMREAAGDVEAAGDEALAQDLRDAADALQGGNPDAAGDALDQLAQDLRELAESMQGEAGGAGTGDGSSGQTGSPEPATRLPGEGGDMALPLEDPSQPGILSPAPPDANGEGTLGGAQDSTLSGGDDVIQSPLVPNSFLWRWRNVVSEYFRR